MIFNTSEFIDIHTHILPGLDDGVKDLSEALAMAKCYSQTGIKKLVATPHFIPGTAWSASKQIVTDAVENLQRNLDEAKIDLKILAGMEIAFHKKLESHLKENTLHSLGNSSYYLIEPSFHGEQDSLLTSLKSLLNDGVKLILAHPERIEGLRGKLVYLEELVARGLYLQINAGSLLGYFGKDIKEIAKKIQNKGCLHLLASDAHDSVKRKPLSLKEIEVLKSQPGGNELLVRNNEILSSIFT